MKNQVINNEVSVATGIMPLCNKWIMGTMGAKRPAKSKTKKGIMRLYRAELRAVSNVARLIDRVPSVPFYACISVMFICAIIYKMAM